MPLTHEEQEWLRTIEEEARKLGYVYESNYHYKPYRVIKVIVDPETQTGIQKPIAFRVPKWEGEAIIKSQKSKSVYKNGELIYLQSYKLQEEI